MESTTPPSTRTAPPVVADARSELRYTPGTFFGGDVSGDCNEVAVGHVAPQLLNGLFDSLGINGR